MEGRKVWEGAAAAAAAVVLLSMCIFSVVEGKTTEQVLHSETFLSPVFKLGSGDVTDSYQLMELPAGHIAMRSFDAEVVDENGISVPLHDVYLHHWVVFRSYVKKGYKELISSIPKNLPGDGQFRGHFEMLQSHSERSAFQEEAEAQQGKVYGTCNDDQNSQYFAQGSESRKTNSTMEAPYGIISGDVEAVPEGYEEAWYLNIHAISTVGIVDTTSCDDCRCKTYNVTEDKMGHPLSEGYEGGMVCCFDKTHCNAETNAAADKREYFLKYTITYVDRDPSVIPLKLYRLDVTDPRTSLSEKPNCKVEYAIEQCNKECNKECIDRRHSIAALPEGGDIIYAALHQHRGGLGGVLRNKDGAIICQSDPIYGIGNEAGNEAGFVVAMTSCKPEPGTMYVEPMEELRFEAYYSSAVAHTGVMSVFFLYVADPVTHIVEVTE